MMDNKKMIFGIILAIGIIVAILFVWKARKAKKDKIIEDQRRMIAEGGGTPSGAATANVKPDDSYDPAADIQRLLNAKGYWLTNDDEKGALQVIQGLGTRARLKKLREEFLRTQGKDLDAWLTQGFDPLLDKEAQVQYSQIINSLK
jgi:hypothetical protein